jgi:hypothetical protein
MDRTGRVSTALTRSLMASSSDGVRLSGPTERKVKHSPPPSHCLRNSTRERAGAATRSGSAGHSATRCEPASRTGGAYSEPASIFASNATSPPFSNVQSCPTACREVHDPATTAKTTTVPKTSPACPPHPPPVRKYTTAGDASPGPLTTVRSCNESIDAMGQSYSGRVAFNDNLAPGTRHRSVRITILEFSGGRSPSAAIPGWTATTRLP